MRSKLVAVGIIAALLCAMMPMAVSAAPTTQVAPTPQKPIFGLVYNENRPGPPVGEIVILPNGHFCCICFGLKPHDSYLLGVEVTLTVNGGLKVTEIFVLSGPYQPNALGVLQETGTVNSRMMTKISDLRADGGEFVVFLGPF